MADKAKPEEKPADAAAPDPGIPEHKVRNPMASEPIVAPDGHVILSQEDIDGRA